MSLQKILITFISFFVGACLLYYYFDPVHKNHEQLSVGISRQSLCSLQFYVQNYMTNEQETADQFELDNICETLAFPSKSKLECKSPIYWSNAQNKPAFGGFVIERESKLVRLNLPTYDDESQNSFSNRPEYESARATYTYSKSLFSDEKPNTWTGKDKVCRKVDLDIWGETWSKK